MCCLTGENYSCLTLSIRVGFLQEQMKTEKKHIYRALWSILHLLFTIDETDSPLGEPVSPILRKSQLTISALMHIL